MGGWKSHRYPCWKVTLKKQTGVQMFLDLDNFLEVAAVNHFLEARTLSFNLFLCRWSTWDSTRWYRRPDAHWPLRSV